MTSSLLAIRAIGAEFANRIYFFVAITIGGVSAILLALSIWLTTYSSWWWLLVAAFIIGTSVVVGVLIIIKLVIKSVSPPLSKTQKRQTKTFVDTLQRLSEVSQTPKFILLFQIVRDIAAPRENGFIASISGDTSSLKRDFIKLSDTFK